MHVYYDYFTCVIFILFQTQTVQMQEPYDLLTYTLLLSSRKF